MKVLIKKILQKSLGFSNYLFLFALFCIVRLRWDRKEKDFLHFLKISRDDGLVLDIGANIGIMTVHMARKLKNARIVAFEPNPDNHKILLKVLRFFGISKVEVKAMALSNMKGNISMVMPVIGKVKMQGLCHVTDESNTNEGIIFKVDSETLDGLNLPLPDEKITAIKIDVENHEYQVFEGAINTLKKHKPLVYCELWDNENRQQCLKLFESLGYTTNVLENKSLVLFNAKVHKQQNFFFTPKNPA